MTPLINDFANHVFILEISHMFYASTDEKREKYVCLYDADIWLFHFLSLFGMMESEI